MKITIFKHTTKNLNIMKKNILVVEDTFAIREEICDILRMEGFDVFEADNGKTGFQIAKKKNPNLIITDILMPEMNGFELFNILAEDTDTQKIPVIFLSAKANKDAVLRGKSLGTGDYIIKPVSPDNLLNVIYNRIDNHSSIIKISNS